MAVATHLSGDAGPIMSAMAGAGAEALADDFELAKRLRTLWDPLTCPASELSLLAWAWSVDFYDPKWSEARRRRTIAESRLYHSRKTTVAGVRMALGYKDATLVRANLPRHGFFCDREPNQAEESAWRKSLSELRIYDPGPVLLPGRPYRFLGRNLIVRGDARLARRASLVRAGVETPIQVIPNADPDVPGERFVLPVKRLNVSIVGRAGSTFLAPEVLPVRTVAISHSNGTEFTRPIAALGDQGGFVETRRRMALGAFPPMTGVGRGGRQVVAPVAIALGFLSLRFSEVAGRRASRPPSNVVGRSRVQREPYTANYLVKWQRPVPRSSFPPGRRVAASTEPLVLGFMEAVAASQAARDVTSISLSATRRLTYADVRHIKAGTRYGNRRDN